MMNLATIFTQTPNIQTQKPVIPNNNVQITDYGKWGFRQAGAHNGSNVGLAVCLQIVYQQCIAKDKEQNKEYQQ